MTTKNTRPIEVGDRFETRDSRDAGRIVEVVELLGLSERGASRIARIQGERESPVYGISNAERIDWYRQRETHYRIRTEVHPRNPDAVGRAIRVQENTLREKYKRVSR